MSIVRFFLPSIATYEVATSLVIFRVHLADFFYSEKISQVESPCAKLLVFSIVVLTFLKRTVFFISPSNFLVKKSHATVLTVFFLSVCLFLSHS